MFQNWKKGWQEVMEIKNLKKNFGGLCVLNGITKHILQGCEYDG